ncbi:MAG TPA: ATP-binding protein [Paenibacillus sp.]|nr:ATP-binding protein [Paenibacillus sp.]
MQPYRLPLTLFLVCAAAFALWMCMPKPAEPSARELPVDAWSVRWIPAAEPDASSPPSHGDGWLAATANDPLTTIPEGAVGAWVRLSVPPTSEFRLPGVLVERLYGLDYTVYEEGKAVFRASRNYDFERSILLVPLTPTSSASELYLRIESKERAGIGSAVRVGDFAALSADNLRKELSNPLLGAAIAFLGIVMLAIAGFSQWQHRRQTAAISLFILSTGTLIVTYSSVPYLYFPDFGRTLLFLFDTSMLAMFPSFTYFVVHLYEDAPAVLRRFARWLIGYSAVCFIVLALHLAIGASFYPIYKLFTFWLLFPLILLQMLGAVYLSLRYALRGNRNAILLSVGIVGFALSAVVDLILLSVLSRPYVLTLWKLGLVLLVVSLVLILMRRIEADYAKLLDYSRELELHSHQLQKTERMRIVSDLAASIAHEIRNPLQVTRGFLQLLVRTANEGNRGHYTMAIGELDRASGIISDFLTFAKPEQDTIAPMDVKQLLCNIETIVGPLVVLHGGMLHVRAADGLVVLGNASKFKQAIINMMKNSIESFEGAGSIEVETYAEGDTVVVRIADNGQGMDTEQIAKLGEPYFSTKTKGTGLGLMVTFRIVEVMNGTLEFRSRKGEGTEAILRFPRMAQS